MNHQISILINNENNHGLPLYWTHSLMERPAVRFLNLCLLKHKEKFCTEMQKKVLKAAFLHVKMRLMSIDILGSYFQESLQVLMLTVEGKRSRWQQWQQFPRAAHVRHTLHLSSGAGIWVERWKSSLKMEKFFKIRILSQTITHTGGVGW